MKNSKKMHRIVALFICCVIMVGVFLPFFVYSVDRYYLDLSIYSSFVGNSYSPNYSSQNITVYFAGSTYTLGKVNYYSNDTYKQFTFYDINNNLIFKYYCSRIYASINGMVNGVNTTIFTDNNVSLRVASADVYSFPRSDSIGRVLYFSNTFNVWNRSNEWLFTFSDTPSGYTLTFDSQGGSAIAAESGVTDVILGDSTGYFPQYIPTRSGYEFLGWSLTPGGTYVRQVSLTEDTTIYANWRVNDGWCQVSFPDNDVVQLYLEGMIALPSNIAVQNNHNFSVYYYNPISIPDYGIFFDEWILTEQLTDVTVTETLRGTLYDESNDIYKLDLSVTGNDITVVPKIYYPHTCKLRWDSLLDNYITVSDGSNTYLNGDIIDYYSYHGLDLTFNVEFPYMYCRMILYEEASAPVVLPNEYLTYYGYADDDSNSVYNYHVHIDSPVDCVLLLNADAIDIDYDPNDPVVSFDESGNAHWVISAEDSFMDVDWDSVYSIIPSDFNGIMGTVFNLKGLAIIGSICFVAAFAIWFVRRGG